MLQSICDDCLDSGIEARYQMLDEDQEILIQVQPLAMRRILENLIDNAHKYGQRAEISTAIHEGLVEIHIRDAGPGIPESLLNSVFQPFVRLEESRSRATGGTGLGLAIAANLIKLQQGSIKLNNHPEGGLIATIKVPRVQHPLN
jgi:signal transduction histidine kinase